MAPADTSPEATRRLEEHARQLTPAQNVLRVLSHCDFLRRVNEASLRAQAPWADAKTIQRMLAEQRYGSDLVERLTGRHA